MPQTIDKKIDTRIEKTSPHKTFFSFEGITKMNKAVSQQLKTQHAAILLSIVGNPKCSGWFLQGIMQQAAKVFKEGLVTLLVVDQLQAYNIKAQSTDSLSEETAQARVNAMRDGWLDDNLPHLFQGAKLTVEQKELSTLAPLEQVTFFNQTAQAQGNCFRLRLWQDWVGNNQGQIDEKQRELEETPAIADAVAKFSSHYAQRGVRSDLSEAERGQLIKYSSQFVLQEAIGLFLLAPKKGISYLGYTGLMSEAFSLIRAQLEKTEVKWFNAYTERRYVYHKAGSEEETRARQALEKAKNLQTTETITALTSLRNESSAPKADSSQEAQTIRALVKVIDKLVRKQQENSAKILEKQTQSSAKILEKQTQFMCLWSALGLFLIAGLALFYQGASTVSSESNYSPYQL
jgi:hypothetical protein